MKKNISIVFALLIIASMALAACQPAPAEEIIKTVVVTEVVEVEGEEVVVTEVVEVVVTPEPEPEMEEPVTMLWNWGTEPPTMDPAITEDTTSVDGTENMFVGLTVLSELGEVEPYLATDWEVGEDADGNPTYTFNLRDDIPWVKYDPVTGETTQEVDEEGEGKGQGEEAQGEVKVFGGSVGFRHTQSDRDGKAQDLRIRRGEPDTERLRCHRQRDMDTLFGLQGRRRRGRDTG